MRFSDWIFLTLIGSLLAGCSGDSKTGQEDLEGMWEVINASRNGRTTQTLDGAYFQFGADGNLVTNITGDVIHSPYHFEDGVITHQAPDGNIIFHLNSISDTSMHLSTNLHNFTFDFNLRRVAGESPD